MQVRRERSKRGSLLVEFAPALFVMLFFFFFPLVNLIGLGLEYAACATLNDLQVREASLQPSNLVLNPGGNVQKEIPAQWLKSLGTIVTMETPRTSVQYIVNSNTDKTVAITTRVVARPFLAIPFFSAIPGLGAPVEFTLTSSRVIENPAGVKP